MKNYFLENSLPLGDILSVVRFFAKRIIWFIFIHKWIEDYIFEIKWEYFNIQRNLYYFGGIINNSKRCRCAIRAFREFVYTDFDDCKIIKKNSHDHSSLKSQNKIHELKEKNIKKVLNSNKTFNGIFLKNITGNEKKILYNLPLPRYDCLRDNAMRKIMNNKTWWFIWFYE